MPEPTDYQKRVLPAESLQRLQEDPATAWPDAPSNFGQIFPYHISTVSGRYGAQGRTYSIWSDEALRASRVNANHMRTECGIMECLEARQRTTALLNWHLVPEDKSSEEQNQLVEEMTKILGRTARFTELRRSLLEALWFGRHLTWHKFQVVQIGGHNRMAIRKWEPRHGDKLMFRYDDGTYRYNPDQVGILVGPAYDLEPARVGTNRRKVESTQHGLAYFLDEWQRKSCAVHKHMIEDGPFDDPMAAGSINGVGIRSRVYWTWYAMQECLSMLMTFMERSALGVEIWRYPMGNDKAHAATQAAAQERIGNGKSIVLVPVVPGQQGDLYDMQHIEPGMAGAAEMRTLLTDYFGHKIKRYILGQTLTSEAAATGLGSGVSDAHRATFADIIKYDARNLEETITDDIVRPLQEFNFPQASNIYLRFAIDTESEDSESKMQAVAQAYAMDLPIRNEDVYSLIGMSQPTDEEDSLRNPQVQMMKKQLKENAANGMGTMLTADQMLGGRMGGNGNGGSPIPGFGARYSGNRK